MLAYTDGFDLLARPTGLLDAPRPNLTRFVFTDGRARRVFPDWDRVADERAFELWLGPSAERTESFVAELSAVAGPELTRRLKRHEVPAGGPQRWYLPTIGELRLDPLVMELPPADTQQVVVLLPADAATADAIGRMHRVAARSLRAVN